MPATPARAVRRTSRLGIAALDRQHPPVFTVGSRRRCAATIAGGHTKNLFLKDKKGALFLVVAREDAAIDLKTPAPRLGAQGRSPSARPT